MGGLSGTDALNAALNAGQTAFDVVVSGDTVIQASLALETVVVSSNYALAVSAAAGTFYCNVANDLLAVSTGVVSVVGAVTVTQAANVLPVSTGVVTVAGAVTVTQAANVLPVSTGVVTVAGTATVTQAGTVTVAGTATITGTASTLLDPYDTVAAGWMTAAGASTAYQCTTQTCVTVAFKAHPDNSGNIWVGGAATVSGASEGFPLEAGESISLRISNVDKAYYWAGTAGDILTWITIA